MQSKTFVASRSHMHRDGRFIEESGSTGDSLYGCELRCGAAKSSFKCFAKGKPVARRGRKTTDPVDPGWRGYRNTREVVHRRVRASVVFVVQASPRALESR